MMRFYADRYADQRTSPALDAGAVLHMRRVVTRPDLAFDFLVSTDADHVAGLWVHIQYDRVPELDAVLGDRRFGVFAHDWRVPHDHGRGVWSGLAPPRPGPGSAVDVADVRAALRDLSRPDLLARSPLAEPGGPDALRERLLAAVEALREHPRDAKLYRALDRTYLRPAFTQERAAEVLGLPFSTYRRHLTQGVARVAERLLTAQ
jgi:hypothetical protein